MIRKELLEQFVSRIPVFEEGIRAYEKGEIDRNTLKGITGNFGSYAQKEGGYMLRLRLPAGRLTKDTLKFTVEKTKEYQINLLKLTTCQTIQLHNLSAESVISLVREALDFGIITNGGGGDNPRNVMASPLSGINPSETFDVLPCAAAAGDYLVSKIPLLHMPRKLKVCFSNTREDEVHALFRDLGFAASENGTFSVYCAGGLGPNPKAGVHIADGVLPGETTFYISAMIRLFTKYGNYKSRAKARTRYLQDTLGEEDLRKYFLDFLEEARCEETPVSLPTPFSVRKSPDGVLKPELERNHRVIAQKQDGLYTVSYHPVGGRLMPESLFRLYDAVKDISDTEIRIAPDSTLYIINLSAAEVPGILKATCGGASDLFEASISCIGSPVCQHGLRNSYGLLAACIDRVRREKFANGVLPKINISGCPSGCGGHQAGTLGFSGHSKKADGALLPAYKVFVNGFSRNPDPRFGTEAAVLAESVIPDFLAALGRMVQKEQTDFTDWFPLHKEEFDALIREFADKNF